MKYKDDETTLWILFGIFLFLSGASFIICCICRRRTREKRKKRHFARLVNDLNAEEKFTLVTPSDDETSD